MAGDRVPGAVVASPAMPAEASALQEFSALLEREMRALVRGDAAAIESLARDKLAGLERLRALPADPRPHPVLQSLRERIRGANQRNGRLLATRLAHIRERLAALGILAGDVPGYDARGESRAPGSRFA